MAEAHPGSGGTGRAAPRGVACLGSPVATLILGDDRQRDGGAGEALGRRRLLGLLAGAAGLLAAPVRWPAPAEAADPAAVVARGLALVRPDARAGLERDLGVTALGELPVYEIDQAIDDVSGTLSGRLTLHWTNRTGAPVSTLPLLLHPNAPAELGAGSESALTVTEVATPDGAALAWTTPRPTLVLVTLATTLPVSARVALTARYTGRLRALSPQVNDALAQAMQSVGTLATVGGSDYGLLASGDGIATAASAYPMLAPYREGQFDTTPPGRVGDIAYNEVAAFRVRSVLPAGVTAVTNLVDAPVEPAPGGGTLLVSEGAVVRDFVLVAARDFQRESRRLGPTVVTSVYRGRDAEAGRAALEVAVASLASFERRFGPYPYTELDVAEASLIGGAGGVEFPAMVLVAGMLYRTPDESRSPLAGMLRLWGRLGPTPGGAATTQAPGISPALARLGPLLAEILEFTVAHEVAHQYFAGVVGNDSVRYPVLDEPLAQYAAALAIEDRRGPDAARRALDMNVKLNYAIYRLLGGPDRPAARPTTSYRTKIEYAGLVYGKAPYLYVTLRRDLGADRLEPAMREAVRRLRFRLATPDDWFGALETALGGPASGVATARRRWLEETHGDADLALDDSGDFVLTTLFPPDLARALRSSLPALGLKPRELLQTLLGGALRDDAPVGLGIDPASALRLLERLR